MNFRPPSSSFTPDLHSYSFIIRDGWLQRIKVLPTFQSVKRWATTTANRVQQEQLPFFGCYIMDEQLRPDGDPNAGEPRFVNELKLGFSIIIQNSNDEKAEETLDTAYQMLMGLLTYQGWHKFPMPPPWESVEIEGISRGSRTFKYGNTGNNQETPIAELRFDLTFRHRTFFPPVVIDPLERIHVTVAYPWPYDPGAIDPPFTVEYDLLQDKSTMPYSLDSPTFGTPRLPRTTPP
jgi:hypothetical protein